MSEPIKYDFIQACAWLEKGYLVKCNSISTWQTKNDFIFASKYAGISSLLLNETWYAKPGPREWIVYAQDNKMYLKQVEGTKQIKVREVLDE